MKAGEHGPDMLYDKFVVAKTKHSIFVDEGVWIPRERVLGRDIPEFIFTLRPETDDRAAQAAIVEYARQCERAYPEVAKQLREQVYRIRRDFPDGNPDVR